MIPESWRTRGICWLCESPSMLICGLCEVCFKDLPRLAPCNLRPASAPDHCAHWYAAVDYCAPADRWIYQFKFGQTPALARHFAVLICAQVMTAYRQQRRLLPDILVPVPMTVKRWRQRGYNQAAVLGKEIGAILGIPCITIANKNEDRHVQHRLNKQQREVNMRKAFQVTDNVQGKRIAIVDDIITTGATVNGLAGALNGEGAHEVDAWAFAYTMVKG